jgi:hypothetical protein
MSTIAKNLYPGINSPSVMPKLRTLW